MEEKAHTFWETCSLEYAHNEIRNHLKNYKDLTTNWETWFLNELEWKDAIVLDYGIGGGYLGKYLFDTRKIKSYIGVDIANRSLDKARVVLKEYPSVTLYNTSEFYKSFSSPVDIFVCQAVIQHFFSLEYLVTFLTKLEQIAPNIIMLQIVYSNTTHIATNYKNEADVARACWTNSDTLLTYLTSYTLIYKGNVLRNDYQFLIFKKRNNDSP